MIGVLLARESAEVAALQPGVLREVAVRLGDHVQKGAVIARFHARLTQLDREMAQAALQTAESDRARIELEQRQAGERAERLAELVRAGVAPEEQLSDALFQSAIAGARVAAAESQRREQSARVDRLRTLEADAFVRAPFSGTVAARYVDPGSAVAAGAPLVRIVSDGPPTLRFAAPERSRAQLGPGTRVAARLRAAPALTLEAEVERIAPEVDPASRLLIVEARARTSAPELESQVLGAMFDVVLLESTDGRP